MPRIKYFPFLYTLTLTFLLGSIFSFLPQQSFAQICNSFAGGSCVSGSCDARTQDASNDSCLWPWPPQCCYPKPSYPSTCNWNGKECLCTSETSNIPSSCVDGSPQNFQCGGQGAICVDQGYVQCGDLTDTNSACARLGHSCSSGFTSSYVNTAAQDDCINNNDGPCCSKIQNCNQTPVAQGCSATFIPANTCGTYAGTNPSIYTQYVHEDQNGNPSCIDTDIDGQSNYTCTLSSTCTQVSAGSSACTTNFQDYCSGGAGYTCTNGNVCTTNITINVYTDYDHSGTKNGNDVGKNGVNISDNGGNNPATGSNGWPQGQVIFTRKAMGNYTITISTPANFGISKSTAVTNTGSSNDTTGSPNANTTFNLGTNNGSEVVTYYVTPLYQIKGNVFNDNNKNGKDDAGVDSGYGGGGTITVTGGPTTVNPITVANDGTWSTPGNLAAGNYTVTYTTALPTGYTYTTNSAWSVTVGDPAGGPQAPVCNKSSSPDAVCGGQNNGSISSLNIGVTNENTHSQVACLDFRVDNNGGGTVEDQFPGPGATCGGVNGSNAIISDGTCSTGAGIVYSCNGTFDFGLGSSNANDWQAGGTTQECFSPPGLNNIRTSYDFLLATAQQSGITPTDMNDPSVCGAGGIADCILDSNLPKGVYIANGNVTLNNATNLPAPADPNNDYSAYIFLINGNLEINNNILIPQGSTALFSAKGNIDVGSGVGQDASNTTLASVNNPNLEGIYSADNTFTVHSLSETNGGQVCNANGLPLDLKLNIVGAVIDNAGQTGGQFVNNRDLCTSDLECPSVNTGDGLNYLLTLIADGQFVLHKNFNWNEVKP